MEHDNEDNGEETLSGENSTNLSLDNRLLATVVTVAKAFSVDAQRINTQGEALFALANERLPAQSERMNIVAMKQIAMGMRLNLLSLRISRLGGAGNETSE